MNLKQHSMINGVGHHSHTSYLILHTSYFNFAITFAAEYYYTAK